MAVQNHAKTERLGGTGSLPVAATMIRKITVLSPKALSFEFNEFDPERTKDFLKNAAKNFSDNEKFFERASLLTTYLNQYPEHDIEKAIRVFFGPGTHISITKKTRTSRTYMVEGGLYIHEEDKK